MTAYALALLAGVLVRLTLPASALVLVTFILAAVLVGGILRQWIVPVLALTCAFAGWGLAWGEVREYQALRWSELRSGDRVLADAIIDNIPTTSELGTSFDASIRITGQPEVRHARLLWRNRFRPIRAGERWQLLLTLRAPRAHYNPGAPDVELHLFRVRVHALGSVVDSRLNRRIDDGHRWLAALRGRIVERIEERVPDPDAAALTCALAVGSTGDMSREQWRVFNATGTSHLVAISGSHVTLFALVMLFLARRVWSFGVWRYVRLSRETFASMFGLAASTAYSLLAGFSVPTQRTLLMLAVWLAVRAMARACSPVTTLSLALIAVLMLDPFAPLASGFWLSFAAIATILCVTHGRIGELTKWRAATRVQLAVSAALAPITLLCFGSIPIMGLLVNLAAIPLFGFVLVPSVLLAVVTFPFGEHPSAWLLNFAASVYDHMWPVMSWAADIPIALIHVTPSALWYAVAALAISVSLLPLPMRLRAACLIGLIPGSMSAASAPPQGSLEATLLDVGNRTALVLRTATHVAYYGDADVFAGNIVTEFLRSEGVAPKDVTQLDIQKSTQWDGVNFHALCLQGTFPTSSCVMHITTSHGGSLLLTDALDSTAELEWMRRGGGPQADIVIIPRRGASTASSPKFIRSTKARWALLPGNARAPKRDESRPAGAHSRANNAQVLATADSGAIRVKVDPVTGLLSPVSTREFSRALWRALP